MEIRKRLIQFRGGKTPDEVRHAADDASLCGKYAAYYDIMENFERNDYVPADELCECIQLFIQLRLRELRHRKYKK